MADKCPFCGLVPWVEIDRIEGQPIYASAVECCEYGDMYFGQYMPLETVKAIFIEVEGYEPPFRDTYLDNRKEDTNGQV